MTPFSLPTSPDKAPCPFSTLSNPRVCLSHCNLYPPKHNSTDERRANGVLEPCHEVGPPEASPTTHREAPGSPLHAAQELPEGGMCLAPSPAHSRRSMCALQNLMKLSSNDFLCKSPAPTPVPSRHAHGHTARSQGPSPLSLGAGGTLWSLSGGFRRKAGPLATSQALPRVGTAGPRPARSPSQDGRWPPGGTWVGLGGRDRNLAS